MLMLGASEVEFVESGELRVCLATPSSLRRMKMWSRCTDNCAARLSTTVLWLTRPDCRAYRRRVINKFDFCVCSGQTRSHSH